MRVPSWLGRLAIAAAVTLVTVGVSAAAPGGRRHPDLFGEALLLAASLATGASGRWPRAAYAISVLGVAAYQALGYSIQAPFFLPLLFTGYGLGLRLGRLEAAGYTLSLFAAFVLAGIGAGDLRSGLFVPVLALIAIVSGLVVAEYRRGEAAREDLARRRESELLLTEERLRIARELHDVVSHSIAMIGVQAGAAAHVIEREPEKAREALVAIKAASRDALRDLRGILGLLRDVDGGDSRTPAAGLARLPELLESLARAGLAVDLQTAGAPRSLTPANDLAAYRIVQEALTNVLRHAPASRATLALRYGEDRLEIEVLNSSAGRAAAGPRARGAGHGITGMRERAAAAGGVLTALPEADGFAVRASLPLR